MYHRPAGGNKGKNDEESGNGVGGGLAYPQCLPVHKGGQKENQRRRQEHAARQGENQRPSGPLGSLPEGDHQDIEAGEEKAAEIGDGPAHGEGDQLRVLRGEEKVELPGAQENQGAAHKPNPKEHPGGKAAHGPAAPLLSRGHEAAEYRLEPLRHPQEQGEQNQHQIADDQIGGQAQLPVAVAGDGKVIEEGDDADGELHHKGGQAAGQDAARLRRPETAADEIQLPPSAQKVGQEDQHTENWAQGGGQRGPPDTHVQRIKIQFSRCALRSWICDYNSNKIVQFIGQKFWYAA